MRVSQVLLFFVEFPFASVKSKILHTNKEIKIDLNAKLEAVESTKAKSPWLVVVWREVKVRSKGNSVSKIKTTSVI